MTDLGSTYARPRPGAKEVSRGAPSVLLALLHLALEVLEAALVERLHVRLVRRAEAVLQAAHDRVVHELHALAAVAFDVGHDLVDRALADDRGESRRADEDLVHGHA